jgi:hypothetical protein
MSMDVKRIYQICGYFAIALIFSQFSSALEAQTFAPVPAISFTKPFAGADPLPQVMMISNVGTGFSFTVTSSTNTGGSWLSVSPAPGCCTAAPGSITATVTTLATLAAATYTGQIVVTSQNSAATLTIPVTLTVVSTSAAYLDNLPGEMSFAMKTAGTAIASQDIQVRNAGSSSLNWTLTSSTSDGGAWLNVSSNSGTAPNFVTVGVNPSHLPGGGLTAGTFVGQLVFSATASTTTVPISVTVGTNILSQVNPINFVKVFGGANPLPQVLMMPSTGTAISYLVSSSTASGGTWLSVSPGPGCCSATPGTITATPNPIVTLPVGSYTAQIVVTTQGNTQAVVIPVTLTVVPAGGTYFSDLPGEMSFSVPTNGTTITSQDLEIRDGGTGTLNWTLKDETSDTSPWLSVSATSGAAPSIISVSVSVANLPNGGLIAGTFVGQIVLDTASGRVTVPVAVAVAANVLGQVNPINFTKVFGGANPLPQTLTIPSTGASISYSVTSSTATGGTWLSVSPGPGCCSATPGTVTATVNASPTLAVGTYTGQIVVTSQGGNFTITVPVTLTVASPSATFFDNVPGQMSFAAIVATSNNPPAQVVQLRNAGGGSLAWTLEVTTSDGGNWLTTSALSGTAPSSVSVSVNRAHLPGGGLLAGTFIGELVFRTAGSSVTVPVTFVLGANILAQVNAIYFTMPFGGNNPLPQTVSIPTTGTAISFLTTSSTATGGAWLSVTPGVGCCSGAPNTVTATVTASPTLAVGTYTGQIVVTTQGGAQALTIAVTLTVAPVASAFFDNLPGQVSFFIPTSTGNPASQTIQVRNAGAGALNWTATTSTSDGGNWMTISAPSGAAPTNVTVGIVTANLPNQGLIAGTFNGQIVFQSAGSTITVPISVYVGTNIFVEAGALNFSKGFGAANPVSQNFTVSSTGTAISFLTNPATGNGGNWLSVVPGLGCCTGTPHVVTASIIASPTLAAGTYTGQIVITSQGGAMAMTVPVTLTVIGQALPPILDFNGDNNQDVFLYDPVGGTAYAGLSNGSGAFTYVYNGFTPGFDTIRNGNFNGDGFSDLVAYSSTSTLGYALLGTGTGTFTPVSLFWGPGFTKVAAGDLNGDRLTDFVIYRPSDGTSYTVISNGDGTFHYQYALVSIGFTHMVVADFNGDGKADVFYYRSSDGLAFLGISNGTGGFAFSPVTLGAGYAFVESGDINGDGKADLLLYSSSSGAAVVGLSTGSGFTFTPYSYSPGFTTVKVFDFNGDGKADVALYNMNNTLGYLGVGSGTGTFTFGSLFWGAGMSTVDALDLNHDGKIDIVIYNTSNGASYTGISSGNAANPFTYQYAYWGNGKVIATTAAQP